MDRNDLKNRLNDFAHRCVKLSLALPDEVLGRHIKGQLIRCSTSASANYRAACVAQSRASFTAKIGIVIEELDESAYWLEFIIDENLLSKKQVLPLLGETNELTKIFISARKTIKMGKSKIINHNS